MTIVRRFRAGVQPSSVVALLTVVGTALAHAQTSQPSSVASNGGPAPKIWVAKTEWDFGRLWWGDPCVTEIEVRNDGDAPLQITNVRTSCGCTAAKPGKNSLAPGESDKIKVTYDSKKGVVNVSQTVTVESNDPLTPSLQLTIKGEIRNLFDGKPSQQIMFGTISTETAQSQTITLTNNLDKPVYLKLKELPPNAPFDIKFDEVSAGREYRLTATTRPPMPAGGRFAELHLLTGIPDRPEMKVNINAYVQERVSCQPPQIVVFSNQTSATSRRDIRVNYLASRPINVTAVTTSHPDRIKAELVPPLPNNPQNVGTFAYHVVRVELPTFDAVPETGASIEITTDDPEPRFQKMTLPITRQQLNAPAAAVATRPAVGRPAVIPAGSGTTTVKPGATTQPAKPGG